MCDRPRMQPHHLHFRRAKHAGNPFDRNSLVVMHGQDKALALRKFFIHARQALLEHVHLQSESRCTAQNRRLERDRGETIRFCAILAQPEQSQRFGVEWNIGFLTQRTAEQPVTDHIGDVHHRSQKRILLRTCGFMMMPHGILDSRGEGFPAVHHP
jgi:hypothetical protein